MSRRFTVTTIGVEYRDLHLLRAILALSRSRSARFDLADEAAAEHADIIVVNQADR